MDNDTNRRISVLVVGARDWLIDWGASNLATAGHNVLRCHEPGEPAFPCNAFIKGRMCPMQDGTDVVLSVRLNARARLARDELGVLCGRSHGLPLVVAGTPWPSPSGLKATRFEAGDGATMVIACEEEALRHRHLAPSIDA